MYTYSSRAGGFLNRLRNWFSYQVPSANNFNSDDIAEKITAGERMVSGAHDTLTSGIFGGNINPYTERHRLMQGIMLSLQGRNEEEIRNQTTKANKEAEGNLNNLALPAEITRA